MIVEKARWARIRVCYPLREGGLCTSPDCYLHRGVVLLRAYDEDDKEYYFGYQCRDCLEKWLNAFEMNYRDIEQVGTF